MKINKGDKVEITFTRQDGSPLNAFILKLERQNPRQIIEFAFSEKEFAELITGKTLDNISCVRKVGVK